ncbi:MULTISPECIES: hypothetical protein [Bradyrhizobium]|uniref:hypothetical protein n=1 Tax=Bradyrhizobium TaxID=374 RepID=UPI000489A76E|nr:MULTISPECIES: hypothetical protein [Bradyrhizobium]MCS3445928.1 hypothetical protein [Bradyrhizobium elkanii]MCS3562940.1 hypothetical protein [Bradyrhizobium elkanii]MCW2147224.1 hypothetical protein [Bradyrhizobium elkanii]MCW2353698.1 hypothetical protein [Bradyrhizobium elkanii]MCW2380055.1 hypothetical protein [Bradyrhizobium elkanii]
MHGNFTTRIRASDLLRLSCEIVVLQDHGPDLADCYRVTCSDGETGVIIDEMVLPAGPNGEPPVLTVGDIAGLIGGHRPALLHVEIEAERQPKPSVAFESALEQAWLAQVQTGVRP